MVRRMDWDRARREQRASRTDTYAWPRKLPPTWAATKPPPINQDDPDLIWIVVGANSPTNTTPGTRQVHCFRTVKEAHAAGFTWAI